MQLIGDGVFLAGAREAALTWVLTAARLADLNVMDDNWVVSTETAHIQPRPGIRLWWRRPGGYVSYDPPEHVSAKPEGPFDEVRDPPDNVGTPSLSQILATMIDGVQPVAGLSLETVCVATRDLLAERETGMSRGAHTFAEVAARVMADPGAQMQHGIDAVYEKCLLALRMPAVRFSDAVLLLAMQANQGQWVEDVDYGHAGDYLGGLVEACKSHSASELAQFIAGQGNRDYQHGQEYVASALTSHDSRLMARRLLRAGELFWRALRLATLNERHRLHAPLQYKPVLAEEGWACVTGGLLGGVRFFQSGLESYVKEHLHTLRDVRSARSALSSPLMPMHSRPFVNALVAAAMTHAPPTTAEGIARLEAAHKEFSGTTDSGIFERNWIDFALLRGHTRAGHHEEVNRYAVRLAGAAIVWKDQFGG